MTTTEPPIAAAVEPYRIPSGHKGGGRFAKRGTVGEAIVRAAKSVYHGMSDAELDAEAKDAAESLAHAKAEREVKAAEAAAFVERSTRVHRTADRTRWPASSSHAAKELDDRIAALDQSIAEYSKIADEIDAARDPHPDLDGPAFASKLSASYLADPRAEAEAFDALPPDAIVKLYHGTSATNADGIADTEVAGYQARPDDISKLSGHKGLYVAPTFRDARNYAGAGGSVVVFHARRGDIEASPEARGATPGQALYRSYEGAIVKPGAPIRVVDRIDGITQSLGQRGDADDAVNERQAVFAADLDRLGLYDWESSKPWQYNADDIDAGRAPGWLQRGTSGTAHASYTHKDGRAYLRVSDDYWNSTPEQRRATLYHEAGHILDAMLSPEDKARAYDELLVGPNFAPSSDNADELVAETFSLMHTNPQWLADNQPELLPWIIDRADANWLPVPDAARQVTPRAFTARRGDTIDDPAALPVGARFENRIGTEFTRTADGAIDDRGRTVTLDYLTGRATADGTPIPNPAPQQFKVTDDIAAGEFNDLAVRPGADPADYITPGVVRWAEAEGAFDAADAWNAGDRSVAPDLWKKAIGVIQSREWINDALTDPDPYPDAIETLRQAHMAAVHELGDGTHEFTRTTDSGDPFAPGELGRALARGRAGAPGVTSWYRNDDQFAADQRTRYTGETVTREFPVDQVLANLGDQAHLGEYLIVDDPQVVDRLMSGRFPIVPPRPDQNDRLEAPGAAFPAPPAVPGSSAASAADEASRAARRAVERLSEMHHDGRANGVDLATLPFIPGQAREMPVEARVAAINAMFNPAAPTPTPTPTLIDGPGPVQAVAVNLDTGQVIGTTRPWGPTTAPPYGRWTTLPVDHPDAPALVTAGWAATPEAKAHIDNDVLPALRHGRTVNTPYVAIPEALDARSERLLADYIGDPDVPVRRVNDPTVGTYYVPDPDGPFTLDGSSARFADFADDGSLRIWSSPATISDIDRNDPLSRIDYSAADDDTLPWDERVAALADARRQLQQIVGRNPADLFTTPTEDDIDALVTGTGGDREFAVLNAFDRFGESLDRLVRDREAAIGGEPDKAPVADKLRELGVPPDLVDFIEAQQWKAVEVQSILPARSGDGAGGGYLTIRFPDDPDTRIAVFTSTLPGRERTEVAWEFSADYQMANPAAFETLPPSGSVAAAADTTGRSWFESLVDGRRVVRPGEDTPAMKAWVETMEGLGVDMGVADTEFYVAEGRNLDGEAVGRADLGAEPVLAADADGELAAVLAAGLRPYPKSWTRSLGGKLTRISIDPDRTRPVGTSGHFTDTAVVDLPSLTKNPEYVDLPSHEFAHVFERSGGLMLIETWHFIQRLRAEAARTNDLATWTWDERQFGYRDDFGDEYMGRVYRSRMTGRYGVTAGAGHEILSTVAQTLWGGYSSRTDPDLDPPARRLLMALMSVVEPDPPQRKWKP